MKLLINYSSSNRQLQKNRYLKKAKIRNSLNYSQRLENNQTCFLFQVISLRNDQQISIFLSFEL